jgi:hypothetical protein
VGLVNLPRGGGRLSWRRGALVVREGKGVRVSGRGSRGWGERRGEENEGLVMRALFFVHGGPLMFVEGNIMIDYVHWVHVLVSYNSDGVDLVRIGGDSYSYV